MGDDDLPGPETAGSPIRIVTRRTVVRLAQEDEADAVVRFYSDNREHLRPFDPDRPDHFYEEWFWRTQLRQNFEHAALDLAVRLFIFPKAQPGRVSACPTSCVGSASTAR
jgi:[ribosomal protein S5]-alanine N-acetyltransferase